MGLDPAFYKGDHISYQENQKKLNPGLKIEEKVKKANQAYSNKPETSTQTKDNMNFEDYFSLEIAKMRFDLEELQEERTLLKENQAESKEEKSNKPFIKENMPLREEFEPFEKEKLSKEAVFLLKNVPMEIYGPSEAFLSFVNSRKPTEKDLLKDKKLVFSLEMNENEEFNGNLITNILSIAPETSKLIIKEEKRLFILEIEENTLNKALESLLIELL